MEPHYMKENRFTHLVGALKSPSHAAFVAPSPELDVARHIEDLVVTGQTHLQHEEYTLALQRLHEAMELILHTMHPDMPIDFPQPDSFRFPLDATMLNPLVAKTGEFLGRLPPTRYTLPAGLVSAQSTLSEQTQNALKRASVEGLRATSVHVQVEHAVSGALDAAARKDWGSAAQQYMAALASAPASERIIRGGLLHDLAVVTEQAGDRERAQELGRASVQEFAAAEFSEGSAQALATTAGIFRRNGRADEAGRLGAQLDQMLATHNFNPVVTRSTLGARTPTLAARIPDRTPVAHAAASVASREFAFNQNAPTLMGLTLLADASPRKVLTLEGEATSATISLDSGSSTSVKAFLTTLSTTKDVGLLTHWQGGPRFIAHLPHIYFYVVPMPA